MPNLVTAWSYSRYSDYKKCPRRFKFKHIDKVAEPEQKGPALDWGNFVHRNLMLYVDGKISKLPTKYKPDPDRNLATTMKPLMRDVDTWRKLVKAKGGAVQTEIEYAVDSLWRPVPWFDKAAWLRAKLDVRIIEEAKKVRVAHVVDYKTGKAYENAHADQLEIYAAIVYPHEPTAVEILAEMMYCDLGTRKPAVFRELPKTVAGIQKKWARNVAPMFRDRQFKATPGDACTFCPFSYKKGGPCDKG